MYRSVNGQWSKRFGASSWHPDNETALARAIEGAKTGNLVTDTSFGTFPAQWNAIPAPLNNVIEITWVNHEDVPHPLYVML